jgi:hypothetical protein
MEERMKNVVVLVVVVGVLAVVGPTEVWAEYGDGSVEHMLGDKPNTLWLRITDPDGIKSYGVRDMVTGTLIDGKVIGCEAAKKTIELRLNTKGHSYPIAVYFRDCTSSIDEVWVLPHVVPTWTRAKQVQPEERKTPREVWFWRIVFVTILTLLVLWRLLEWGAIGPFRRR